MEYKEIKRICKDCGTEIKVRPAMYQDFYLCPTHLKQRIGYKDPEPEPKPPTFDHYWDEDIHIDGKKFTQETVDKVKTYVKKLKDEKKSREKIQGTLEPL